MNIEQKANQVVDKADDKELESLLYELSTAQKHAEGCGCHQCKMYFETTQYWFYKYAHLVHGIRTGNAPDHEEEWIADKAGKTHLSHWDDPMDELLNDYGGAA